MSSIFKAIGTDCHAYGDTPKAAAQAFFEGNPGKRKCDVCEGVMDGGSFVYKVDLRNKRSFVVAKDVTKAKVCELVG